MNKNVLESFIGLCNNMMVPVQESDLEASTAKIISEFKELMKQKGYTPSKKTFNIVNDEGYQYISFVEFDDSYSGTGGDYDNGLKKNDIEENKKFLKVFRDVLKTLKSKNQNIYFDEDSYRGFGSIHIKFDKSKTKYDANGNKIYQKSNSGDESWFDKNGKIIHQKYFGGSEYWAKYDKKGNRVFYKDNHGEEKKFTYWDTGKVKTENWSDGRERQYDNNGKTIYYKDRNGFEEWYTYGSDGERTEIKDSDGNIYKWINNKWTLVKK